MIRLFMRRLSTAMIKLNIRIGKRHDEDEKDYHWMRLAQETVGILTGCGSSYHIYS
jgi:hypothetical protein